MRRHCIPLPPPDRCSHALPPGTRCSHDPPPSPCRRTLYKASPCRRTLYKATPCRRTLYKAGTEKKCFFLRYCTAAPLALAPRSALCAPALLSAPPSVSLIHRAFLLPLQAGWPGTRPARSAGGRWSGRSACTLATTATAPWPAEAMLQCSCVLWAAVRFLASFFFHLHCKRQKEEVSSERRGLDTPDVIALQRRRVAAAMLPPLPPPCRRPAAAPHNRYVLAVVPPPAAVRAAAGRAGSPHHRRRSVSCRAAAASVVCSSECCSSRSVQQECAAAIFCISKCAQQDCASGLCIRTV